MHFRRSKFIFQSCSRVHQTAALSAKSTLRFYRKADEFRCYFTKMELLLILLSLASRVGMTK